MGERCSSYVYILLLALGTSTGLHSGTLLLRVPVGPPAQIPTLIHQIMRHLSCVSWAETTRLEVQSCAGCGCKVHVFPNGSLVR
jgi:hypothetical protein